MTPQVPGHSEVRNMVQRRISERGEGKGGCIVGLIILLAAVFIAYKMIPVKIRSAEMRQTVTDEAKIAGSKNEEQIRKSILAKAYELKLNVNPERLEVNKANERIKIKVEYTVPVEFPGYTYNWNFRHTADAPVF